MNEQFKILSNFMGFGNPKGKIWFVGLEEAQDFEHNLDTILQTYSNKYIPFEIGSIKEDSEEYGNRYTKVYDIMAKIMVGIAGADHWEEYRNNKLLTTAGNEFQMNLYPLGKKNLNSWPDFYRAQFGFVNKHDYLTYVQTNRFPVLYDYWKLNSPEFTICFGIGNIEDFKTAFRLKTGKEFKDSNSFLFSEEKVLVTPFFDYRFMNNEYINKTISLIKNVIHR